jgi:hypothetical protein
MDMEIKLNGKTYFFMGRRIYNYRLTFWGKQVYRDVPPNGPLAKKLRAIAAKERLANGLCAATWKKEG